MLEVTWGACGGLQILFTALLYLYFMRRRAEVLWYEKNGPKSEDEDERKPLLGRNTNVDRDI